MVDQNRERKEKIRGADVTANSGALLSQNVSLSIQYPDLSLAMETLRRHLDQPFVEGRSALGIYFTTLRMNFAFLWNICNPTFSLPSKPGGIRKLPVSHRWGCCSDCPSPWIARIPRERGFRYIGSLLLPPTSQKRRLAPPLSSQDSQILENEKELLLTES